LEQDSNSKGFFMSVNLQKSYSALNEKLAKAFDESGVRRSFTVPYIDGQGMDEHIASVGQAAMNSGGLTNNLLTTAHHSGGKGWGSGEGHTIGHPSEGLRSTIIPKNDEHVKAAIDAASKHLSNIEELLGKDDSSVKTAKSQLDLVKKTDAEGMNMLDFGVLLTQVMYKPMQAVARLHSGTKDGGHSPQLRAPGGQQAPDDQADASQAPQGGDQPQESAQQPPQNAAAAPDAQAAPAAAPAAPQAQG
jgi:hypothetical protein